MVHQPLHGADNSETCRTCSGPLGATPDFPNPPRNAPRATHRHAPRASKHEDDNCWRRHVRVESPASITALLHPAVQPSAADINCTCQAYSHSIVPGGLEVMS